MNKTNKRNKKTVSVKAWFNKYEKMLWINGITFELSSSKHWRQDGRTLKGVKTKELPDQIVENEDLLTLFNKVFFYN